MNIDALLLAEVQNYINANLNTDLHFLLLKKSPFPEVSMQEIVQQIKGKKIAEKKFPFLLKEGIVFPPHLNLEQSSSESTSIYKGALMKGNSFVDLTSGFGIDAYFLSQNFTDVTLVEQNTELLQIVEHNWNVLGREAKFVNSDLKDFLTTNSAHFDCVYLDPARRNQQQQKVFLLEDLSPNLLEIQKELRSMASKIVIKLSPLIDLSYLISVLDGIQEIHIVAVKNEVKEILVFINPKKVTHDVTLKAINLETNEPSFEFCFEEERVAKIKFSDPLNYIYIPNNSLLKAGAFNLIAARFALKKLHANTHFYTSQQKVENFPGRVFAMAEIQAKELKKGEQYNIISKNHPLKPELIKKKYQLKDGGEEYLIFTQSQKGKIILKSVT